MGLNPAGITKMQENSEQSFTLARYFFASVAYIVKKVAKSLAVYDFLFIFARRNLK